MEEALTTFHGPSWQKLEEVPEDTTEANTRAAPQRPPFHTHWQDWIRSSCVFLGAFPRH